MEAYVAQLRVYEPLAAFPDDERRHWEAYAAAGSNPDPEHGPALEREAGLRALAGVPPAVLPQLPEHAYVTQVDGATLVCPWRTGLRAWEALLDFRAELPDELADAFAPRAAAEAAEEQLERWQDRYPDRRSHVLSSTWQVPLRWFVLVDAAERVARPGTPAGAAGAPPGRRTGRSLVYRTAMSRARRRGARALSVLRRSLDEGQVTAASRTSGAGWRSSTRCRWWSWTTAGWCTCSTTPHSRRTSRPATSLWRSRRSARAGASRPRPRTRSSAVG